GVPVLSYPLRASSARSAGLGRLRRVRQRRPVGGPLPPSGGGQDAQAFFCPAEGKGMKAVTLLGLDELFAELRDSKAGVQLLLVGACRNDPSTGRSLDVDTLPRPPRGTAALFSCSSGQRAFETDKLRHGVFFHFVLEGLKGGAKNEEGETTPFPQTE